MEKVEKRMGGDKHEEVKLVHKVKHKVHSKGEARYIEKGNQ